ncbi:unnamed protein product, partial [Iphiclides podalirius]
MYGYIVFGLLIFFVIFAYVDHEGQYTSTASAIKQIWSGSCRLSCRNKKSVPLGGGGNVQLSDDESAMSSRADPGNSCVCASCPCELVENVLDTCSPVARFYAAIVEAIFLAYYDFICACTDLYERGQISIQNKETAQRILQNGAKHQATVFTFDESAKIVIKRAEDKGPLDAEQGTSNANEVKEDVTKTKVAIERPDEVEDNSCPSCVEKGFTCIGRCPAERFKRV